MVRAGTGADWSEASSSDLSIWPKPAMPARIPTGTLRITIEIITMAAVPVRYTGALLKARMYDARYGARNGKAQHSGELDGLFAFKLLTHHNPCDQQAEDGGDRRGNPGV